MQDEAEMVTFLLGVGLVLAGLAVGYAAYVETDWALVAIAAVLEFLGIGLLWWEH